MFPRVVLIWCVIGLLPAVVLAQETTSTQADPLELTGNPIDYEVLGDGTIILKGEDSDLERSRKTPPTGWPGGRLPASTRGCLSPRPR